MRSEIHLGFSLGINRLLLAMGIDCFIVVMDMGSWRVAHEDFPQMVQSASFMDLEIPAGKSCPVVRLANFDDCEFWFCKRQKEQHQYAHRERERMLVLRLFVVIGGMAFLSISS